MQRKNCTGKRKKRRKGEKKKKEKWKAKRERGSYEFRVSRSHSAKRKKKKKHIEGGCALGVEKKRTRGTGIGCPAYRGAHDPPRGKGN